MTKISWWKMLVIYRWTWCRLSLQISRLTFTYRHLQFEWHRLLHLANGAGIPGKFTFPNNIDAQINFMGPLLPCALVFKPNRQPYICSAFGMSADPRHVISIGPRQPEVPSEASVYSGNFPILNHHSYSSQYIIRIYSCFNYISAFEVRGCYLYLHIATGMCYWNTKCIKLWKNILICPHSSYRGRGSLK